MNVHRNVLLEQYLEKVLLVQVTERDRGRAELVQSAVHYLNTADLQQRFAEPILTIFSTNISAKTSFDFVAARNVFSIMEKYVINLLDCPWKREFRKITMYSGFYKTQIEPSLKDAWRLLLMVGYEKVGMCLELKFLPDASRLHNMAFEFYLASLECLIYKEVFQKISSLGFTMNDIHQCRRGISISSDEIFKALSKLCVSKTRDERESCETKESSRVHDYLSKLPNSQLSVKNQEYEAKFGSEVRVGGTQSESNQWQTGCMPKVVQLPEPEEKGNGCEPRSESFEAMLREITPEMLSDINTRRKILTKMNVRPQSAKSHGEPFHASLPLHQVQRESDMRPYTEPLLIPKQLKPDVASASDIQPYSEPPIIPKHPKTGVASASDIRPFKELLLISKRPKSGIASASDRRSFTEPLHIPKHSQTGVTDTRPFTEPLHIPKHLQTGMTSASYARPLTERLLELKQYESEHRVMPNIRPYTEQLAVQKQKLTLAPDQRPWTEPLLIPTREKVSFKPRSKSKEHILLHWRCEYCFYLNCVVEYAEKCELCGTARKKV